MKNKNIKMLAALIIGLASMNSSAMEDSANVAQPKKLNMFSRVNPMDFLKTGRGKAVALCAVVAVGAWQFKDEIAYRLRHRG